MHGEDAMYTANTLFHSSSVIKQLGSGENLGICYFIGISRKSHNSAV